MESDEGNTMLSMIVPTVETIEYEVSIFNKEEDIAIRLSEN